MSRDPGGPPGGPGTGQTGSVLTITGDGCDKPRYHNLAVVSNGSGPDRVFPGPSTPSPLPVTVGPFAPCRRSRGPGLESPSSG
jgi:hypothetical protein